MQTLSLFITYVWKDWKIFPRLLSLEQEGVQLEKITFINLKVNRARPLSLVNCYLYVQAVPDHSLCFCILSLNIKIHGVMGHSIFYPHPTPYWGSRKSEGREESLKAIS